MQVPAPFEYERATSVEDAVALLERLGDEARIIAGGHSLLPMMKLRLAAPEHLVDINDLEGELSYLRVEGEEIRIGALTRAPGRCRRARLRRGAPPARARPRARACGGGRPARRWAGTAAASPCR